MGGIFVTGHDPDFHAAEGNMEGARNILRRAAEYVTFKEPHTYTPLRTLLVTSIVNPNVPGGPWHRDPQLGLNAAELGLFDVATADPVDAAPPNTASGGAFTDIATVDFRQYALIIVASDHGGWLKQAELDSLNARRAELINYVNGGGGLIALAESNGAGLTPGGGQFGFLPFLVSSVLRGQTEQGYTLTSAGMAMGLRPADTADPGDVDGNVSHCTFGETGGMDIIDVDAKGNTVSLATRELVDPERGVVTAARTCGESCVTVTVRDLRHPCAPYQSGPESFQVEIRHCDGQPLVWRGVNFANGVPLQLAGAAGGKIQGQFTVPQGCYLVRAVTHGHEIVTNWAWVNVGCDDGVCVDLVLPKVLHRI